MLIFDQVKRSDPRLRALSVAVATGMSVLLIGLWYIQVVSAKRYRADLLDQSFRTIRIPAIRGKILDRNGFALAENRPSYNLNLYIEELRRSFRYEYTNGILQEYRLANPQAKRRPSGKVDEQLQRTARYRVVSNCLFQVSSLIQEAQALDEREFHRHYDELRSLPFPLVRDLSPQQVALFAERSSQIPSLNLEVQPMRSYPRKSLAAHLLGHLKREDNPPEDEDIPFQFRLPDYVGVMGIERAFDQQLRGRPGVKSVLVNNLQYRQSEQVWLTPEPGQNVVLTIDVPIQLATERALRKASAEPRGAAVVMDCRNGDILAMASVPSFDPNMFIPRVSEEDWAKLSDEHLVPQFNRATYGRYAPGSVFKIVVALACLEAGLDPNELFESRGYYQINGRGRRWKDTAGPGTFDFDRAFYRSSNPYFQDHGLKLGFEKIAEMGRQFRLGKRTGLSSQLGEAAGYFPEPSERRKRDGGPWMAGVTANLCIGQGEIEVTPLQVAVMTATVANGGKVLEPRLIDRIEPQEADAGGTVRFASGQIRARLAVQPRSLEVVRKAMLLDVEHGSGGGRRAAVEGLRVCGKTGTAERIVRGSEKEHVTWFASFAPYEAPRYAVVVVIEGGDWGSETCAPIARDIYEAIVKRERGTSTHGQALTAMK